MTMHTHISSVSRDAVRPCAVSAFRRAPLYHAAARSLPGLQGEREGHRWCSLARWQRDSIMREGELVTRVDRRERLPHRHAHGENAEGRVESTEAPSSSASAPASRSSSSSFPASPIDQPPTPLPIAVSTISTASTGFETDTNENNQYKSALSSWDEFAHEQTFRLSNLLTEMVREFNASAPRAPWKLDTVFTVMIMWVVSFWIAAYKVVPSVLSFVKTAVLAPQNVTLSYSGEAALRHLLLDASQMVVIALLLQRALRSYAYREFFAIRSKSTSTLSWIAVGFGVALFPAVDWLHKTMVTLISGGGQYVRNSGVSTSTSTASMFDGDGVYVKLLWFLVLGVAAPVWEEIMFRGFLLPSLARATSPVMGVLMTSLIFSFVHFTREGFLPLMVLGTIFGVSYCVTRGLFTPILLHGLWNVCLLAQVMWRGGL